MRTLSSPRQLSTTQRTVVTDLLKSGSKVSRDGWSGKWGYTVVTGDRPSNFRTERRILSPRTVDSLFAAGWLGRYSGNIDSYDLIVPDGTDVVEEFAEVFVGTEEIE